MTTLYFNSILGNILTVSAGSSQGSGYSENDQITIDGGSSDAVINVDSIGAGGSVATWSWVSRGSNYGTGTDVTTTSATGTGFLINIDTAGGSNKLWSDVKNWFTDSAATIFYAGPDAPWTADDASKAYDLGAGGAGYFDPYIDLDIGHGFVITGTQYRGLVDPVNNATIYGGNWEGNVWNSIVGVINGGTFLQHTNEWFDNYGTINGGTFHANVNNNNTINNGTFYGYVLLHNYGEGSYIYDGTFNGPIFTASYGGQCGTIYGGTFNGDLVPCPWNGDFSGGTINSSGNNVPVFNGTVTFTPTSGGEIGSGIFNKDVLFTGDSTSILWGGTFNKNMTFLAGMSVQITGGTFYGDLRTNSIVWEANCYGTLTLIDSGSITGGNLYPLKGVSLYGSPMLTLEKGINGSGILGMV